MNTDTVILPAYLASALVNGDTSGLTDDDEKWFKAALDYIGEASVVEVGESYFSHTCDLWGHLACDVAEYTILYHAE